MSSVVDRVVFTETDFLAPSGGTVNAIIMENITLPAGSPGIVNIFYNHGSGYTAVTNYRFQRYKFLLSQGNVRVFSYDYAGYGKSTGPASEAGLKETSMAAYEYFRNRLPVGERERITVCVVFVWVHALRP